jgi:hypothetical protein
MIYRDPKCVYVANSPGEAGVIVAVLAGEGIAAEAMNQATLGGLLGLTPYSATGVSAAGIEVWVHDPAQAEPAREFLAEHAARAVARAAGIPADAVPVEVECEECGESNRYPAADRGKVQTCGRCGAYLDVPGEEEEWDVGDEEAEEGGPP